MEMGVCACPNFGSAQQWLNQGEIYLFTRRAVRVVRCVKRQDRWPEQHLPAEARRQPDSEPPRTEELPFGLGFDGLNGSTGIACHALRYRDASRTRHRWQRPL